ncbi:MAG: hypothetical protein WCO29_24740 [Nostocales cyanobacterium ELA583]
MNLTVQARFWRAVASVRESLTLLARRMMPIKSCLTIYAHPAME